MKQEDMKTILRALQMSSPHTDALYRWQDPEWHAQRREAIELLMLAIEPAPCGDRQNTCAPA